MTALAAFCVGIAGGTGSGKTTLARTVCELLGPDMVTVIEADSYYRDLSHLPAQERHLGSCVLRTLQVAGEVEQVLQLGTGEVELLEEVTVPEVHTHGNPSPL